MQVSVESISNIERRLTITVPFEQVDGAFDKRISKIAKTAKVKGFREGKVPLDQVKRLYGDTARQEALSEIIQSSLYTALEQEKLNPVGTPTVEPKMVVPGQPLEYVATVEILPSISQVAFQMSSLEKEVTEVVDQDIQTVIEKITQQHVKWNAVNRAARDKDQVVVDFIGRIDSKPFAGGEAKNYPIVIGSKVMIPGFEEGLIGHQAGDKPVVNVTFPETYFAKEVAGKAAEFSFDIKQVNEAEVPEINEAFVKRLGVQSGQLDDLKTEIRKNIQREVDRLTKTRLKTKLFNQLLAQNPIEVPKSLIETETKRLHDQLHPHHGPDHHHSEAEMASFKEAAQQNVALGLLVAELVKQHKIAVDQEAVNQHIQEMASSYEKPEEVIAWYQKNKRNRAEIEMQVMEEMVMNKLLEQVKITEKMISYTEFMKLGMES